MNTGLLAIEIDRAIHNAAKSAAGANVEALIVAHGVCKAMEEFGYKQNVNLLAYVHQSLIEISGEILSASHEVATGKALSKNQLEGAQVAPEAHRRLLGMAAQTILEQAAHVSRKKANARALQLR